MMYISMSSRLAEPAATLSAIIWQAVLMLKFYTIVINPGLGLDYRTFLGCFFHVMYKKVLLAYTITKFLF